MTQLSDKEHNVQMEDMRSFDEQMPCVGVFWYDPEEHSFFGVHKKTTTSSSILVAISNVLGIEAVATYAAALSVLQLVRTFSGIIIVFFHMVI